jgi:uncharacterized membrane protein YvbJ
MNCKQCGHILNSNQIFCPNCGTKVEQGQVVNNNDMYNQQNMMNNQMYQQQNMMNNQMNGQYQKPKKTRYHWEYGCLCFFIFWVPYLIAGTISLFASPSVIQSSFFQIFQTICTLIGLCTIPVFVIEAIIYSNKVKKNR